MLLPTLLLPYAAATGSDSPVSVTSVAMCSKCLKGWGCINTSPNMQPEGGYAPTLARMPQRWYSKMLPPLLQLTCVLLQPAAADHSNSSGSTPAAVYLLSGSIEAEQRDTEADQKVLAAAGSLVILCDLLEGIQKINEDQQQQGKRTADTSTGLSAAVAATADLAAFLRQPPREA